MSLNAATRCRIAEPEIILGLEEQSGSQLSVVLKADMIWLDACIELGLVSPNKKKHTHTHTHTRSRSTTHST